MPKYLIGMKKPPFIENNALIKMIESEGQAERWQYLSEIHAPLSLLVENADVLGPLTLKEKLGTTRWKLIGSVSYSRFRPGDSVELRVQELRKDISVRLSPDWTVREIRYPQPGKIEVIIDGHFPHTEEELCEVFLFKSCSAKFKSNLAEKARQLANEPSILGDGRFNLATSNVRFNELYEALNSSQKEAIRYLIENDLNGAIQGPPGTGKTQLLRAVISLALNSGLKVGVTSFTHSAIDNLLSRVISRSFTHDWARIGESHKVRRELYSDDTDIASFVSPGFHKEDESRLVGVTLHKLAFSIKSAPRFDLLVIDEAGQVPIYFWPFIQRLAKRVVLVGDQFQLPPVLAARHAHLPHDNIFSFLISEDTRMLETQYRMRREIQAWSSEKFYKGKLVPDEKAATREFRDHRAFSHDGFVVSKSFDLQSSASEASYISHKIELLQKSSGNLESVGVICPYRAQAGVINASLQNKLGPEAASRILVDTVERFQGQEREAIFLSFGKFAAGSADLQFLSDPKRLNVSITRAKSRFYCLYEEALLKKSQSRGSEDLNEFLRWVVDGNTKIRRAA